MRRLDVLLFGGVFLVGCLAAGLHGLWQLHHLDCCPDDAWESDPDAMRVTR